jgi:hypothetical protein
VSTLSRHAIEERHDLVAFLESLTDSTFLADPRLGDPWPGSMAGLR